MSKTNHGYQINFFHNCINCYQFPKKGDWSTCPNCNLKPKVWRFENVLQTACGCWNSKFDIFSVSAESIISVYHRCKGDLPEWNSDQLRINWNEYCATMINPCSHTDLQELGRW